MSPKKKYLAYTLVMTIVFFYLLTMEVLDRWEQAFQLYDVLARQQRSVLNPEELAENKMKLLARRQSLGSMLTRGAGQYDQSETGVFEYISTNARKAAIHLESLTPVEPKTSGQITELGFKLQFASEYHRLGAFLNSMENGAMMTNVRRIDIASRVPTSPLLQVSTEEVVSILSSKHEQ
jgi:hypothetical protein